MSETTRLLDDASRGGGGNGSRSNRENDNYSGDLNVTANSSSGSAPNRGEASSSVESVSNYSSTIDNASNRRHSDCDDDVDEEEQRRKDRVSLSDILYGIAAFWETLKPVAVTIILASLACNYIVYYDENTQAGKNSDMEIYAVGPDAGNSERIEASILNALIVVSIMATFTFIIVFLYWIGATQCLYGYLVFASAVLLSVLGGLMFYTGIQKYGLLVDSFTFYFILYNFSVVGVLSIFYSQGISKSVTQGYLIATSVIMAWNLSSIDEYTCWALLIGLAFYDLCAVMTPCGPLKALVSLMAERNEHLPGLLYEADLTEERTPRDEGGGRRDRISVDGNLHAGRNLRGGGEGVHGHEAAYGERDGEGSLIRRQRGEDRTHSVHKQQRKLRGGGDNVDTNRSGGGGYAPEDQFSQGSANPLLDQSSSTAHDASNTPPSAHAEIVASRYVDEDEGIAIRGNSIKLGLGDFVFYSVLISKASMYGFIEFFTTFLIVLSGLGATLVLLAIHKIPLPALPFSIFFGVFFYFMSRFFISPFLWNCSLLPIYV